MKLPDKFKAVWYLFISALVSSGIVLRAAAIYEGTAKAPDVALLLIWLALMLYPIADEVSLFGVKLKKEIDEIKGAIQLVSTSVQNEVRNAIGIVSHVAPTVNVGYPPAPPEAALPAIEERFRAIIRETLKIPNTTEGLSQDAFETPDENRLLFAARFNIETELRRIYDWIFPARIVAPEITSRRKRHTIWKIVEKLAEFEVITPDYAAMINDLYAVCSQAVHGEKVSDKQLHFVKSLSGQVLAYLRNIPAETRFSEVE